MARFWLQLACVTAAYAFLQPNLKKASPRREIQVKAVADLLPDEVVNSLSEEQLTALYNAPDAVAGAAGGVSEFITTKVGPALGAEAAALGELAGKASEAFSTKVVPALKEGGDALKPAVEQALTSAGAASSETFTALLETSRAAGWTDNELAGACTIALFLTAATIKKQATPPPPPPPTPAEKAAVGAKKALSGALDLFEVVQGRPYTPLKSKAVEDAVKPIANSAVTIYKTIDSTAKRAPTYTETAKKSLEKAYKDAPAVSAKLSQQAQSALSKKAQETQKAAQEAAKRAAARGGPYAELLKERATQAAAKRAAALKEQSAQAVSVVAERSAPAVQTINKAYSAAAPAVTKAYSAAAPVVTKAYAAAAPAVQTAAQKAAATAGATSVAASAAAMSYAVKSAEALRSSDAYRKLAAKPSAAAPLGAFLVAALLALALPKPEQAPPPPPEPVVIEPDPVTFELPEFDFSSFELPEVDLAAFANLDLDNPLAALAAADAEGVLTGVRAILYVPVFVGTFVLALPPGDQAALFVALLAAAVASGRKS